MAEKKIQLQNAAGTDILYPQTTTEQVVGLEESLSTKQDLLTSSSVLTLDSLTSNALISTTLSDGTTTKSISDLLSLVDSTTVFIATYGVTPYSEVKAAFDSGRLVVCYDSKGGKYSNGAVYSLCINNTSSQFIGFGLTADDRSSYCYVKADGTGTNGWYKFAWDMQRALVSGTNIKTINNTSLLGSGNIALSTLPVLPDDAATKTYTLQAVNGTLSWVETTWSD